jgi:hypothetical protein
VPRYPEQHLAADHHRVRDRVGVDPENEDELLPAGHGHRDDLGHRLGDDRVQAAGQRVMLGLWDAYQAVFPCGVLVLDADEDDAAIRVAQRGHRRRCCGLSSPWPRTSAIRRTGLLPPR